jgi:D-alanyl-D-alanine carboxypeptidase
VPDYGTLKSYQDAVAKNDTPWSRERLLPAANADQLLFQPGTGWAYSNIGYMFVADAIVAVTGLSLAKSLERLVLAPLSATSARLATEVADFQTVFWPEARTFDPRWVYHGCLIGTPFDAARILHALVSGQMLRSKTLEVMTERHELGGPLSKAAVDVMWLWARSDVGRDGRHWSRHRTFRRGSRLRQPGVSFSRCRPRDHSRSFYRRQR